MERETRKAVEQIISDRVEKETVIKGEVLAGLEGMIEESSLGGLVDSLLAIEKARVAKQVRKSHLAKAGKRDHKNESALILLMVFEEYIDGLIASEIEVHPAHHWFSRVKGIGKENIAKVVGFIDIARAQTISSVWKYSGMHVVNGKAPKPVRGKKLDYNKRLQVMCFRLGVGLLRAKGKFYDYYEQQKQNYVERYNREGVKIVPTFDLPQKDGKYYEPEGMISEGHVHMQALRKMIKLFLGCLWLVWREAVGLPTRAPYAIEKLEHTTLISPWSMIEKPETKKRAVARK